MPSKLSDNYPHLVGKVYCGDCLFLLMDRADDVVTGDMNRCYKTGTLTARHAPPCANFRDKRDVIKKMEETDGVNTTKG